MRFQSAMVESQSRDRRGVEPVDLVFKYVRRPHRYRWINFCVVIY
ncbi:unnamed protein product [Callosobruchus maculatus]|uniref:Uncharacterized protein n=1 Tax=Callosobruchus maculatus TaxID=64391 RepID=A0A653BMG8_CALMS|nr:unnamed protein product [Callosobruchus maculatus]